MKYIHPYFRIFLVAALLYMSSCTDDGDSPGTSPTTDKRDSFTGVWAVSETSSIFGQSVYESEIIKNSSIADNIAVDNFYQLGLEVITQVVVVSGSQLTIPQQTITQKTLEGSGQLIDKNTIEFNFTVDDGAAIDSVNCIYSRK